MDALGLRSDEDARSPRPAVQLRKVDHERHKLDLRTGRRAVTGKGRHRWLKQPDGSWTVKRDHQHAGVVRQFSVGTFIVGTHSFGTLSLLAARAAAVILHPSAVRAAERARVPLTRFTPRR